MVALTFPRPADSRNWGVEGGIRGCSEMRVRLAVRHCSLRAAAVILAIAALTSCSAARGQSAPELPRLIHSQGRHALLVDGRPYLILGAQVNNSSNYPGMLPKVWPAIEQLQANTVLVPVAWEQIEARQGKFDFSFVDTLLGQAREHRVHLILLWFGTWKNTSASYTPEWVKLDTARYPRVINTKGERMVTLSPHAAATLEADRNAVVRLMRHLKEMDAQHTVIMVQVENESGTYGSVRDYSPAAQKLFSAAVPATLLRSLQRKPGTWQQVFGHDADEFFHAWSIASYIQQVAAAGKAEYPLPLYVNVALRDPLKPGPPGTYASGGPTDNVLDIWKAAAPALDLIAPDIYMPEYDKYTKVLDLYQRPDNALFVGETGNSAAYPRYFFPTLGHQGIGFSPFGLDFTGYSNYPLGAPRIDSETLEPFAMNYRLVGPMMREFADLSLHGKVHGVAEDPAVHTQTLSLGRWQATVSYGLPSFWSVDPPRGNPQPVGGALIAELGADEFLVAGFHARVSFDVADPARGAKTQFARVEEGTYENGAWKFLRVWNGDQTDYGLNFTSLPQVLKVRVATY
ncbi:MAG: glycoside hydrolase [Gammaproteobacteria bacterium]|nr:glycoside hydrolase [Gammaproteobacteria bacterium]